MTAAAVLLAVALLVAPAPARTRLGTSGRPSVRGVRTLWWVSVPVALLAVIILQPTVVLAVIILLGTLSVRRRGTTAARRRRAESASLRDGLDILTGELRAGSHPVTAFGAAGTEVGAEVGTWLAVVAARARLGADVGAGIRSIAAISTQPENWTRLAVCWQLAHSHGLAIATLMRAAHHDIVERERFRARVEAGLAGARTTAVVLAAMPVLGIALGQLIGADPLAFLVAGGAGGVLLVIGITLSCLGLLWSDRIVTGLPT